MTVRYRCSNQKCRTRRTLEKDKLLYVTEPLCRVCKSSLTNTENERREESKRKTCKCDGLHYPHRIGSKWCNNYTGNYSQEDLNERNY